MIMGCEKSGPGNFGRLAFLIAIAFLLNGQVPVNAFQDTNTDSVTDDQEAVDLFDGSTLNGWSGDETFWSVADGAIVGQTTAEHPTEKNTFLIFKDEVSNFELELEFRLTGGNSGLQFRSSDKGDHRVTGYQADFDATNSYTGIIYEEGGRGILVPRAKHVVIDSAGKRSTSDEATCDEKAFVENIKSGDWNTCKVIADGSQITHMINGIVSAQLDDGETGKARESGIIALQLHAGPPMKVEFRNIRLKRLP